MKKLVVIVIGASAGGVQIIQKITDNLPENLPAAVLVVMHLTPYAQSYLPEILNRRGALLASHAQDMETIQPGHIYVAPPNHHLELRDGRTRLTVGPRENGTRPAVDPLFRTAAWSHGSHVIGILLTGYLGDGAAGLMAIKSRGGIAIVQDPEEAVASSMPLRAIQLVNIDYVLPADKIAAVLVDLVANLENKNGTGEMEGNEEQINELISNDRRAQEADQKIDTRTFFSCPDCGGAIWQVDTEGAIRFVCHTGHSYSPESMYIHLSENLEQALWSAIRIFKERASLARQVATRARDEGDLSTAERLDDQARLDDQHTEVITSKLLDALAVDNSKESQSD